MVVFVLSVSLVRTVWSATVVRYPDAQLLRGLLFLRTLMAVLEVEVHLNWIQRPRQMAGSATGAI